MSTAITNVSFTKLKEIMHTQVYILENCQNCSHLLMSLLKKK